MDSNKSINTKAQENLLNAQNIITLSSIITIQKITMPSPRLKTIIVSFLTYFHENIVEIMEDSAAPDFIETRNDEVNDEEWITMLVFFEKPLKILNLIKTIESLIRQRSIEEINIKRAATIFFSSMSEKYSENVKELRLEDVFYNLMLTIFKYEMEFGGLQDINTKNVFSKETFHSNHIIFEESEDLEASSKEQSIKDSDITKLEKLNSCGDYDNYKNYLQGPDSSRYSKKLKISPRKSINIVNGGGSLGFVDHGSISTIEFEKEFD